MHKENFHVEWTCVNVFAIHWISNTRYFQSYISYYIFNLTKVSSQGNLGQQLWWYSCYRFHMRLMHVCSPLLLLIQNINTCATIFSGPIKVNYIYIYIIWKPHNLL